MSRDISVCLILVALSLPLVAQTKDPKKLVGQTATLCATVVTFTASGKDGEGCAVRLDLAGPSWRPVFYARIPAEAWASYSPAPDRKYPGQQVCVTGPVQADKNRVPHIVVTSPDQIEQKATIALSSFGEGIARACEKGMVGPKLLKSSEPIYPRNLLSQGVEGHVLVQAVVGTDGLVSETRIVFADEGFGPAGEKAVKNWRFTPGMRDGVPVPAILEVQVRFTRS